MGLVTCAGAWDGHAAAVAAATGCAAAATDLRVSVAVRCCSSRRRDEATVSLIAAEPVDVVAVQLQAPLPALSVTDLTDTAPQHFTTPLHVTLSTSAILHRRPPLLFYFILLGGGVANRCDFIQHFDDF